MINYLQVSEVEFRGQRVGFCVSGMFRDCSDSLWEVIEHHAIFRTRERAERLLERVRRVPSWELNLKHWNIGSAWARREWIDRYSVL